MLSLFQRLISAPLPDEKKILMDGLQGQLLQMRAVAVAGKSKCLSEGANHKSKLAAKKLAYTVTYFDKIIELLSNIIDSQKPAFIGLPPPPPDEPSTIGTISGPVINYASDSDVDSDEGEAEDDWTSDEEEDVYEHYEEVAHSTTPALEIVPVTEISADISLVNLQENINQLHSLIQRFYSALEYQFFYKENSYAELLSLKDYLHNCVDSNKADLIKLKLIICQTNIVNKKMELIVYRMAIFDLLNGTNNARNAIVNLLKKKLAELNYINSLNSAVQAQDQLITDSEALDDSELDSNKRELLESVMPANKSNILVTKLVVLFQHIKLDLRLAQMKMPEPLKTELVNLIEAVSEFHNRTYCDPDNLQACFHLDPELITKICRLLISCDQKYKSEIDSIISFIKKNATDKPSLRSKPKLIT